MLPRTAPKNENKTNNDCSDSDMSESDKSDVDSYNNFFRFAGIFWYCIIIFGMTTLFIFAFLIPPLALQPGDRRTAYSVLQGINYYILIAFQSQFVLQVIFYLAVAAHVFEAFIALVLSLEMGCRSTYMYWTLQTLLLGYPSLRLLLIKRQCRSRVQ
jgi:hypothetical protein